MFETNKSAKVDNALNVYGDDNHLWSQVLLSIHTPWFYIVINNRVDEDLVKRNILLLSKLDELSKINAGAQGQVEQVYLVSPGHINKCDRWMMEPLERVLSGLEPHYDQSANVYVVGDGRQYVDSGLGSSAEELREMKTVYVNSN